MANPICGPQAPDYPNWTGWQAIAWKAEHLFTGSNQRLFAYKDAWVIFHAGRIKAAASRFQIPPVLLAGVAWIEVGGDLPVVDHLGHALRSFDWSGPPWVDRNLTITRHPSRTSFGSISIQLRRAAETIGLDPDAMSYDQRGQLIRCLETDGFNIDVVARHLHDLIRHDYPNADTSQLTDEQLIVAGSRYNRGTERALADIIASISAKVGTPERAYSEYGRTLLRRKDQFQALLVKP